MRARFIFCTLFIGFVGSIGVLRSDYLEWLSVDDCKNSNGKSVIKARCEGEHYVDDVCCQLFKDTQTSDSSAIESKESAILTPQEIVDALNKSIASVKSLIESALKKFERPNALTEQQGASAKK